MSANANIGLGAKSATGGVGVSSFLGTSANVGYTFRISSEDEDTKTVIFGADQLNDGRLVGPAKHAALTALINSKSKRVIAEIKQPGGRVIVRTMHGEDADKHGMHIRYFDRVRDKDGSPLPEGQKPPQGTSFGPSYFSIDGPTRRIYEPPRPGRRHRNYQDRRQEQLDDTPIPLSPDPKIQRQTDSSNQKLLPDPIRPQVPQAQLEESQPAKKEQYGNGQLGISWNVTKTNPVPKSDDFVRGTSEPRKPLDHNILDRNPAPSPYDFGRKKKTGP